MKNKIFVKLMAIFAVVLVLFSTVLGGVFIMLFRLHTLEINRKLMEQKAVSIADTISSFQEGNAGGYGAYTRFLDELAMAEVWIIDKDMNISAKGLHKHWINHTDIPENAEQILSEVFSGKITYGQEFSGLLDASSITVGAPIRYKEKVVGAVLVHSPTDGITQAVSQGLITVVISSAAALFVAGLVATLVSYRFTKPLSQMKDTAVALSKGEYSVKTNVSSQDEIGQLAQVLDSLSFRLKEAEENRENLDKVREAFVANISHELRTPVAVIRGSLELLLDNTVNNPAEILEYHQQMFSEIKHLERLVNDLLELSRLQDPGFNLQMQEVNLCDVVKDSVRSVRTAAQAKEILIETVLPDCEILVSGDYDRIRQLIIILLDNAVKFSDKNKIILVSLTCDDSYKLTITDRGKGISAQDLPHIFDRFHKINSYENKEGAGLGLAIAKEIVKRHGAEITVESDDSETSFCVVFPKHNV
ncbi:MAG TPA: HAMP domain-containing sensor histidine kinase [Clostridiales bacterium]|nr:HAMP domain-containing sensor histidine kinase [Clostridiales bacterium]